MGEISTKKTVDEEILARLQALEVLLMEQSKEIDAIKEHLYEHHGEIPYGEVH